MFGGDDDEEQEERSSSNLPSEIHDGNMKILLKGWSQILMEEGGTCMSSLEEATIMAEVLLEDLKDEERPCFGQSSSSQTALRLPYQTILETSLQENMGLLDATDLAKKLLNMLGPRAQDDGCSRLVDVEVGNDDNNRMDSEGDRDDDGIALFDGECELCDRYIQLTKHHLIPKSTWPRIEIKLMHAAQAIGDGNNDKAVMILGPGLVHLLTTDLQPNKQAIRSILHKTCDVCRPCHSTIHRTHDNMTLALSYSTINLLLQDKQISDYCRWASKQRAGKYAAR